MATDPVLTVRRARPANRIDLTSPAFKRDPIPAFHRLREEGALVPYSVPFFGAVWLVTTYAGAVEVLRNSQNFVRDPANAGKGYPRWLPPGLKVLTRNMLGYDEPDHRRLRSLVNRAFQRQNLEELRGRVEAQCDALLAPLPSGEPVDLVARFARPFPLAVICELLGLPPEDRERFTRWVGPLTLSGSTLGTLLGLSSVGRLVRYLRRHIQEVRKRPRPGLITALVQIEEEGDRLDEEELLAMIFLLLVAGHETTVHLISGGLLTLLEAPERKDRLRADPSLIPGAVEELLRYVSPVQTTKPRFVARDLELLGHLLRRGEIVMPLLAAANCDPDKFPDPERLDFTRHPNPHLSFGAGIHFCLGAQLARMEAAVAFTWLFDRFPEIRLAVPAREVRWTPRFGLRGVLSLPVILGPERLPAFSAKQDVPPPWIKYPGNETWWGGWRQGTSEAWLVDEFLPFWRGLSPEDRQEYLTRWPPPDGEWLDQMTKVWV